MIVPNVNELILRIESRGEYVLVGFIVLNYSLLCQFYVG